MKLLPEKIEDQRLLLIIISAALIIRLIYVLEILNVPFSKFLYSDPKLYYDFASSLFTSEFWSGNDPFILSPIYPIILSLFQFISDKNNFAIYIFQAFLGTGIILIIYRAARNLFDASTAMIAAIGAAFFDAYIFYAGLVTYETIEIFLASLLIYFISYAYKRSVNKDLFLTGIILGLLILLRESYIFFTLVFLVYI
ncbi:MAG: glycosyltransferase family 39 protein, partial [Melioribacteraceae bacterium]|nr:glycosyltransferase family 39 protein [Melioribacteraceae bacterium]